MKQINDSLTDPRVIQETMRLSLKITSECGKEYFHVTYDSDMTKIAMRIRSSEEIFERLFIHLELFHIMLSFFKAVGNFIDGCGLTNILVDSGISAHGSVNTFLTGKSFNRCRKIHPLALVFLQHSNIDKFLDTKQYDIETVEKYLKEYKEKNHVKPEITNQLLVTIFEEYE